MVTVIRAKRRSAVLTPSSLACLSIMPTINLTTGCLHDCVYCYIRGYRNYPGEGRIVLFEDTLEKLRSELRRMAAKPRSVYFSPSSDLFQPAAELLELTHAVLEFFFSQGIGVGFLTKGAIPNDTMRLLTDNAELVRAQIGLVTLDERISQAFEPHAASPRTRLRQLGALIEGGVEAEARVDPMLPTLTDNEHALGRHFAALAQIGVRRAAAGVLFLRPTILPWMTRNVPIKTLRPLLRAYASGGRTCMRGSPWPIQNLPVEARREIFARIRRAAGRHGIELRICACKNQDLARGTCNIAGTWPRRPSQAVQPMLVE